MANEDLEVRIGGNLDDLKKALKDSKKELKGFQSSMNTFSNNLKNTGRGMMSFGKSMNMYVALPMLLAGSAAVKMGSDFDESMTKIKTLVGIASDEVDSMTPVVKRMAKETGIASKDAAEALFFITSAGIKGGTALEVLEASLKASASGLGETKNIADIATSAMNAYGKEVLSATDATDTMLATVREGKLAPEELAGSMGRVLPIASAMKVSFNEVGAAFASLSRTGTNAAEAATQIRGIFSSLLKPTNEAEEALVSLGLSSKGLRENLASQGLISTLKILKRSFEGNEEAAALVFGNIRALSGVLDLVGNNAATTSEIFKKMESNIGDTAVAFEKVTQSSSFRLKKSLNDIKEVFVNIGSILLPIVIPALQKLAGMVTGLVNSFNSLTASTKEIVLGLGGLALVLPTIITAIGGMITVLGALLSPIGLAVAALAGLAYVVTNNWDVVNKALVDTANYFIDLYNESLGFRIIVESLVAVFKNMWTAAKTTLTAIWDFMKDLGNNIVDLFGGVASVIKGVFTLDASEIKKGFSEIFNATAKNLSDLGDLYQDSGDSFGTTLAKSVKEGYENAKKSEKIEFVTEDDVNKSLSSVGNYISNKWNEIKNSIFGGGGGASAGGVSMGDDNGGDYLSNMLGGLQDHIDNTFPKVLDKLNEFNEEASDIIKGGIASTFMGIGDAIGNALVNGGNVVNALGASLLGSLGGILTQLGQMAIAVGIGIKSIKASLKTLSPAAAIGAGIALVALGSAVSAGASKLSGSIGGSSVSSGGSDSSYRGSSTSYSNSGSSSNGGLQNVVFEIKGTKLVGVLKNTLNKNKSLGGTLTFG